jgi:hypothetical protein
MLQSNSSIENEIHPWGGKKSTVVSYQPDGYDTFQVGLTLPEFSSILFALMLK